MFGRSTQAIASKFGAHWPAVALKAELQLRGAAAAAEDPELRLICKLRSDLIELRPNPRDPYLALSLCTGFTKESLSNKRWLLGGMPKSDFPPSIAAVMRMTAAKQECFWLRQAQKHCMLIRLAKGKSVRRLSEKPKRVTEACSNKQHKFGERLATVSTTDHRTSSSCSVFDCKHSVGESPSKRIS